MLHRLQRTYHDLLVQSLEGAVWVELNFKQKPDAVTTSTRLLLGLPHQSEQRLPSGISILQVYTDAQGELLILGEPGSGKSTLLLSLAQQLIEQALTDKTHPLPIILPLSSWANKQQPLREWCCKQIAQIYHVSFQICEQWMQHNQLLLLLDGLDEVKEEARPACVDAINAYHGEHMMPLVVCSREAEYADLSKLHCLTLQQAVTVRPLTKEQIDQHLSQAGESVAALRKALTSNAKLQELAQTPLMLNILILMYQGTSVRNLLKKGPALQRQVIGCYIQSMIERKGDIKLYSSEDVHRWLGWLAYQLQKHNQPIFYPELLQPDWLPPQQLEIYLWLAVRLPSLLIGILTGLLTTPLLITYDARFLLQYSVLSGFIGVALSIAQTQTQTHRLLKSYWRILKGLTPMTLVICAILAVLWCIMFMLNMSIGGTSVNWQLQYMESFVSGLIIGLSGLLFMLLLPQFVTTASQTALPSQGGWSSFHSMVSLHGRRALLAATIFGAGIWLSETLSYMLSNGLNSLLDYALGNGLSAAFNYGLLGLMVSVMAEVLSVGIHLTERLRWTRKSILKSLFVSRHLRSTLILISISSLLFGLSQGLGPWLEQGPSQALSWALSWGLSEGLSWGLSCGLSCWLLLGLFQGISHEQVKEQDRRLFNQGIHDSLRNCVFVSIISFILIEGISILSWGLSYELSYGLNYGVSWGLSYELSYELSYGLNIGLSQGLNHSWLFAISGSLLVGAVLSGGLTVLRHYVLRLLLQRTHLFPLKAQPFLEDAGRRILLRCIDSKYSFTHKLLQDYFAEHMTNLSEER